MEAAPRPLAASGEYGLAARFANVSSVFVESWSQMLPRAWMAAILIVTFSRGFSAIVRRAAAADFVFRVPRLVATASLTAGELSSRRCVSF